MSFAIDWALKVCQQDGGIGGDATHSLPMCRNRRQKAQSRVFFYLFIFFSYWISSPGVSPYPQRAPAQLTGK